MLAKIIYRMEPDDRHLRVMIDESFNLLRNFATRLSDPDSQFYKSFHRVVVNGEFSVEDMAVVYQYAMNVATEAEDKYLPLSKSDDEFAVGWAESILANANRMRETMETFRQAFTKAAGKPSRNTCMVAPLT